MVAESFAIRAWGPSSLIWTTALIMSVPCDRMITSGPYLVTNVIIKRKPGLSSVARHPTEHGCGSGHPLQGRSWQREADQAQPARRQHSRDEVSRRARGCAVGQTIREPQVPIGWGSRSGSTVERIRLGAGPMSLYADMRGYGLGRNARTRSSLVHVTLHVRNAFSSRCPSRPISRKPAASSSRWCGSTGFAGSALQVDANPGAAGIVGNAQAAAEQESR